MRRAKTSACAARRQATLRVARQGRHRRSVRPPARSPARPPFRPFSPEPSAPLVIPPVLCPLFPFLPPSSNLCLLLLLALPPRPVVPFYPRVVQATACKPLGPRAGVWSSSPSMLCLLFSPMLPILSFPNVCTRAAPYVPRRTCCAVRAAPCRTRHAVRAAPCVPRCTWSNLFEGCA